MQFLNICTKKTYEKNGEKKTQWLQAGTLRITDDGKQFIELNHLPDTTFYVFEPKKKEAVQPTEQEF
jgi:hypothetical protein